MKKYKLLTTTLLLVTFLNFSCKSDVVNETSNPLETWTNALKKLNGVKFFHAKKEINSPGGKQISDIYYSVPDRKWVTNIVSNGHVLAETNVETIYIGLDRYEKEKGGKWSKDSFKEEQRASVLDRNILPYSQDWIAGVKDAKFIKSEVLDGKGT